MRLSIAEILKEAAEARGKKKKIAVLHENSSKQLKAILDYTFNPSIQWLLEADEFKYKPCDDSMNSMRTRLFGEIDGLRRFISIGEYLGLKQSKRHELFLTLLETLHPEDAKLIIHIAKNKSLPYDKLSKETVAEAFPLLAERW